MDFIPTHIFVDGSSFLYRAYYIASKKDFRNAQGEPIGTVMIYSKMLQALRCKYPELPMVVVFDAHGKCFRKDIYSEYKANRKSMPDDLVSQEKVIKEIIKAMGCDLIVHPNVEADDVLGTFAAQAQANNAKVLICSGDKDLFQLVNENVVIEDTMNNVRYDIQSGTEKFGVPPELMVDLLALKGDSSDNIPGMPKVGDVTSKILLNSIGSIETIKNNLDKIQELDFKGAKTFAQKFIENIEIIELSYKLAKILTDVDLPFELSALQYHERNVEQLGYIYKTNGLKSLYASLNDSCEDHQKITNTEVCEKSFFEIITTQDKLDIFFKQVESAEFICLYVEKESSDCFNDDIPGLFISLPNGNAAYIPYRHSYLGVTEQLDQDFVQEKLASFLSSKHLAKVVFDAKQIMHVFKNYNIDICGVVHDVMIEDYLLNSTVTKNNLDSMALTYLNMNSVNLESLVGKGKTKKKLTEIDIETFGNYCSQKASFIMQIHRILYKKLQSKPELFRVYNEQFLPMERVLFNMERHGAFVSVSELNKLSTSFEQLKNQIEQRIFLLVGHEFNISSPKQVAQVLFEEMKMLPSDPILRKQVEKGKFTTNEEMLTDLSTIYEIPSLILEYRTFTKLKNTYTDVLPSMINFNTGRIHTTYHLNGTITGRLSSSEPNLQNIPIRSESGKLIRKCFIAPEGYKIVAADYSQIELRILAILSKDKKLQTAFNLHQDIHTMTASEVLGIPYENITSDQRRNAKAINFGIVYGMSSFGLSKQLKIDRKVAKEYIDNYFSKYPSIKTYLENIVKEAKQKEYVETIGNRVIPINGINSTNVMLSKTAERVATNAPMQGSAADIIQIAMIKINEFIENEAEPNSIFMVLQVHDELVFEIKDEFADLYAKKIKDLMESVFNLDVKLEVSVGIQSNWEQAH